MKGESESTDLIIENVYMDTTAKKKFNETYHALNGFNSLSLSHFLCIYSRIMCSEIFASFGAGAFVNRHFFKNKAKHNTFNLWHEILIARPGKKNRITLSLSLCIVEPLHTVHRSNSQSTRHYERGFANVNVKSLYCYTCSPFFFLSYSFSVVRTVFRKKKNKKIIIVVCCHSKAWHLPRSFIPWKANVCALFRNNDFSRTTRCVSHSRRRAQICTVKHASIPSINLNFPLVDNEYFATILFFSLCPVCVCVLDTKISIQNSHYWATWRG